MSEEPNEPTCCWPGCESPILILDIDVKQRLTTYPPGSLLLAVEPGTRAMESTRHKQFFHLLDAAREWFRQDGELDAHIAKIRSRWGDMSDMHKPRQRGKDTVKPKPTGRAYR